jgi:hypothetical protein
MLQQLANGEIDTEAIEEYIKDSRPDLLPALLIWQRANSENAKNRRRADLTDDYTDDADFFNASSDLFDVGSRILETLDHIHKELRGLRIMAQQQQEINTHLAQALEDIAEALDFVFSEPGWEPEFVNEEYRPTRQPDQVDRRRHVRKPVKSHVDK